jgi:lactoylglutathione lyase
VIVYVSDLAASVAFYRDVAGLEHRFTDAGYAEFGTGATRLASTSGAGRSGSSGRR